MPNTTIKQLKELLKESVEKCYENDKTLIDRGMEQASVARIYYYMQEAINADDRFADFREYNLDSEYNKNGKLIKGTIRCKKGTRPDIILHKRNSNDENLLILEFKSFRKQKPDISDANNKDRIKLEDFTNNELYTEPERKYGYSLGVFIKLNKEFPPLYVWFQNGRSINESELYC